ncbi:SRPBCC family protein [Halobacteria archaeon AArc-m2/3/4]|uniref:SRPBCC family protein n=1 Tax=Natronoglomus mannanivorans TaxID=2979990 RepID=A0ABT2QAS6_9EURY|nr:SRPBCC family protein [Halobacteria archaeon AArc-m2/3/4]
MSAYSPDATTGTDESDASEGADRSASSADAGRWERITTATLGGALVRSGLRRRSLGGAAMALAGGWLVYRGVRGRSFAGMVGSRPVTGGEDQYELESESESTPPGPTVVQRSITVQKPTDELTEFWLEPEHLSRIFGPTVEVTAASEDGGEDGSVRVTVDGDGDGDEGEGESESESEGKSEDDSENRTGERYHWTADGPLDRQLAWESKIVEDRPGEFLRWETLEGATIPHTGTVHFRSAPGDRGTEVTLSIHVDPPGGTVGEALVNRTNLIPKTLVGTALRRFKSLAETGEIPSLEQNPSGRGSGDLL